MHEVGDSRNLMWGKNKLMHEVGDSRNLMWGKHKLRDNLRTSSLCGSTAHKFSQCAKASKSMIG